MLMSSVVVSQDSLLATDVFSRDEMNLAEFPITRLGSRDERDVITYNKGDVRWEVKGSWGLPDEFGDRVLVALLKLATDQNFEDRKISFQAGALIKQLNLTDGGKNYQAIRTAFKQLGGISVLSRQAFWDNRKQKRVSSEKVFHLFDEMWLSNVDSVSDEDTEGYVIWSQIFWDSIKSGYVKKLNYSLYLRINGAVARRLYRLLDKWFYKSEYIEVDVFDLASRIGMQKYKYPSKVLEKLLPALEELEKHNFIESHQVVRKGHFTRIKINKQAVKKVSKADNYLVWDSQQNVYRDPKTWEVVESVN
jgi:hypothetical protein